MTDVKPADHDRFALYLVPVLDNLALSSEERAAIDDLNRHQAEKGWGQLHATLCGFAAKCSSNSLDVEVKKHGTSLCAAAKQAALAATESAALAEAVPVPSPVDYSKRLGYWAFTAPRPSLALGGLCGALQKKILTADAA